MQKTRSQAPKAKVSVSSLGGDERLQVEQAYDLANPEFKHGWKDATEPVGDSWQIVEENGQKVENKMSILCRISRKVWDPKRKAESDASLNAVKSLRNEDGRGVAEDSLVQFASPKRAAVQE